MQQKPNRGAELQLSTGRRADPRRLEWRAGVRVGAQLAAAVPRAAAVQNGGAYVGDHQVVGHRRVDGLARPQLQHAAGTGLLRRNGKPRDLCSLERTAGVEEPWSVRVERARGPLAPAL